MYVRYIGSGDPTDDNETTVFGETFVKGEWVESAAQVAGNPVFETSETKPKAEHKPKDDGAGA